MYDVLNPLPNFPAIGPYKVVMSTALEASHIIKASPGNLVYVAVRDATTTDFLMIINSATVPADGAVTLLYPAVPLTNGFVTIPLTVPIPASNGIVLCTSTTGTFTKTLGGATSMFLAVYQ